LVYGNEKGTLPNIIADYIQTLPFVPVIGNGKWELYPLAVDDLAEILIKVLKNDSTIRKVYDLGCAQKVPFEKLILTLQKHLRISKKIIHVPFLPGLAMVYLAKKVFPSLPLSVDNVLGSNQVTNCNPQPANKEFNIRPMTFEKGVEKYFVKEADQVKRLNVAVVGLGKMGILHTTILNTMPHVTISAIIDTQAQLINTVRSMGIHAAFYSSLPEALKKQSFDCVYICTPTFAHKEIMQICMKKKIPYFVEKPVFQKYNDFKEILGKTKGGKNAAGYFWIFKREVQFTKRLLEEDAIGKILSYTVNLKHSEVFGPKKGWTFKKALSGGGVLINPGPHAFSVIQYLFKKCAVRAAHLKYLYKNEVEDEATVSLEHIDGVKGELHASWSVPNCPVLTIEFEIVGEQGSIAFQNNVLIVRNAAGKKRTYPLYDLPADFAVFNLKFNG
jgi:predicted dehydrogenase